MAKKHVKIDLAQKKALWGYIFCAPFLVGFLLFFLTPLIRSIVFSFSEISPSNEGMIVKAIGTVNYITALKVDPYFLKGITESLKDMAVTFPSIILYSFFIATILNQKFKGRTIARVMFFLPVIITTGVIYFLQNDVINTSAVAMVSGGATDSSVDTLNLTDVILSNLPFNSGVFYNFVTASVGKIYYITISSGVQILIFLAGLQTINPSIYEASSMEGASGWVNFWKITLPMVSPLILVNIVYTIIDSMSGLSNYVINNIYRVTFTNQDYGLSAAMSWIYLLFMIIILGVVMSVVNKMVFYENT